MRRELAKQMEALLAATGRPWEIVKGTKHYKIFLAGKMIAVGSVGSSTQRDPRQLQSAINRRMRELSGEADNRGSLQGAG
jgi:hypothetical protein